MLARLAPLLIIFTATCFAACGDPETAKRELEAARLAESRKKEAAQLADLRAKEEAQLAAQRELEAARLELQSMTTVLTIDEDAQRRQWEGRIERAAASNDMDELVRALKDACSARAEVSIATLSKLDALEAFLLRNEQHAEQLGFSDVREKVQVLRAKSIEKRTKVVAVQESLRDKTSRVAANGEWQSLGVEVEQNDYVIVYPTGNWAIGEFAGSCGAQGINNDSLQSYALVSDAPVGSLVVRAGRDVVVRGLGAATIAGKGGDLEARCNDRDYLNNSGSIDVRIVAFRQQ